MKTVLITGASYGIGEVTAQAFLDAGWKVYGLSRSKPEINSTDFIWLEADLSEIDNIPSIAKTIPESKLDVFISNAGVIDIEPASAVSLESYYHTFNINLLAPMVLVKNLKEKIKESTIITISSVSDRIPEPDVALYCSSKAANTSFFNSLAKELTNARVFAILPDYVDTPMLQNSMKDDPSFDWSCTIKSEDIAKLCIELSNGTTKLDSGSNIIVVTEALKGDLENTEKLYGYNTDTGELVKLN